MCAPSSQVEGSAIAEPAQLSDAIKLQGPQYLRYFTLRTRNEFGRDGVMTRRGLSEKPFVRLKALLLGVHPS